MGKASRNKGKHGELELSHTLQQLGFQTAHRSQQYCGTPSSADVIGLPGVHIECKRSETLSVYAAYEQAVKDSVGSSDLPVVMHRRSRRPWLVIMSDGEPNNPATLKKVQEKIRQLEADRKLVVFAIGIGSGVNMDIMDNFSKRKAKKLKGYKFEDFFEWLGKSVSIVSQSQVGEKVKLDTSGMDDWAEI